jgi:GNAT superfamily N-acetyltransferase
VTGDETDRVVAYYASSTASVLRDAVPRRLQRNQPDELPAILLGRMAVDNRHAGRGLGAALLKHFMQKAIEVSAVVGVRLALVHAKDDEARRFYVRYGFVETTLDPLTLVMPLPGRPAVTSGSASRLQTGGPVGPPGS